MDAYTIVKTVHIVSGVILFGTGLGAAFFFLAAHRSSDLATRRFAARTSVRVHALFGLPALVVQPLSGIFLVEHAADHPFELWLSASYCAFLLACLCWTGAAYVQLRMARMLEAQANGHELDAHLYRKLLNLWFLLGWPAFLIFLLIFWLMVAEPAW